MAIGLANFSGGQEIAEFLGLPVAIALTQATACVLLSPSFPGTTRTRPLAPLSSFNIFASPALPPLWRIKMRKTTLSLVILLSLLTLPASAQVYTVRDIGPNIYPVGINAKGQVSASGLCSTCGPNQQALLWSASTGLKDLGGSINNFLGVSAAFGLNDLGEVVGTSNSPFSPVPCCDAFLWTSSGEIQDLGAPPGCAATGVGINDSGKVVGENSPNTSPSNAICHLFLWDSTSGMQDIGFPLGAFVASVSGINNAGTAVGGYIRASDFTPRSYIWTSLGGFRDLGIPQSEAVGINAKGHTVGRYNVACVFCNSGHAFLWEPQHGVRDLGVLPGQTCTMRARAACASGKVSSS
jgi:uncharacterized membrane protein